MFTLRVNMHRNLSYERSVATRWLAIAVNILPYSSTQLPKQSYNGWASMELIKFLHDAYIIVNLWFTVWNGEPGSGHDINFDSGLLHTPWPASRNSYVKWYVPYIVERHSWASYVLLNRVMYEEVGAISAHNSEKVLRGLLLQLERRTSSTDRVLE